MIFSLLGSFVAVCWWYMLFLVHSLSLYDGNIGFLECVDVKHILNTKNRSPISHNVWITVKIVFVDVTVSVTLLVSLNFSRYNFTVSFVCLMLVSLRATA